MKTFKFSIVILITFFNVTISFSSFAQTQDFMSYQAVIRTNSGTLLVNTSIGMQISILQGSTDGTAVFVERHFPTSNANALVSIEIGNGTVLQGDFSTIDWANGPFFIKTETDTKGGANYTITGTSQLLSVPYAMYAKKAGEVEISEAQMSAYATKEMLNTVVNELQMRLDSLELFYGGITDSRDGNHYNVVKIGNQIWMKENLRYLPNVVDFNTGSESVPYFYVLGYTGNDVIDAKLTSNYKKFGVLYNWSAAMNNSTSSSENPSGVQGICPTGWHLPSNAEWAELIEFLGGSDITGGKLKESGTTNWAFPNTDATNESNFTALPGNIRYSDGTSDGDGYTCYFWTSTSDTTTNAINMILGTNNHYIGENNFSKAYGVSVRCIKD